MITVQVQKIQVSKNVDRQKIYTPIDITDQVVMPIIDVDRLDNTLDTSSLTLINKEKNAIKPFTRMIIRLDDGETTKNIYRLVYSDETEILTYGLEKKYKHNVQLIEPTKWLERFEVDNTTITNLLAFLYDDSITGEDYQGRDVIRPYYKKTLESSTLLFIPVMRIASEGYREGTWDDNGTTHTYMPFFTSYDIGTEIDFRDVQYDLWITWGTKVGIISKITGSYRAKLKTYTVHTPSQTIDVYSNGQWNTTTLTFSEPGEYTVYQRYKYSENGWTYDREYKWKFRVLTLTQTEKKPKRKTLAETAQLVLQRVGDETSILRENESQFFSIEGNAYEKLNQVQSPEFTFSQNTLFGILEQIGEVVHTIPRLIPNTTEISDGVIDDWSNWNLITFDELGGDEEAPSGELIEQGNSYNGDNYGTNYTTNVENSFQTNKEDYISITEPYGGGFMSTRTESSDYEVSANSACIKLSRPVQRIVQVICRIPDGSSYQDLDITSYVKESTDYNLLDDYIPTASSVPTMGNKEMAIYYTRGDNVIRGLDYVRPARFGLENFWIYQAIFNILRRATGGTFNTNWSVGWTMDDLMFQVKYVPYYGMKLKQYKGTIEADSGNNELFFNQQNAQMVDIRAFGENVKGALLRTANEEVTRTEYFKDLDSVVKIGQKKGDYYAYQVNKEITNYRVKATIQYSKNWNKWNEYVAIKKNYRQWEISEKESVNTNPVKNEFCIARQISDTEERGLNHLIDYWTAVDPEVELPTANRFWGWMIVDELPTQAEITAFAESNFTEEFESLQDNDEVVVQLGTTTYQYFYDTYTEEWTGYEAVPHYLDGKFVGALDIHSSALKDPGVSTTTVPASWEMQEYYYDATDVVVGRRIYKTAQGDNFQSLAEMQSATTFYHDGEEVVLRPGDYAVTPLIPYVNIGYNVYTRQYDASVDDADDIWVLTRTSPAGSGSSVANTRSYTPLLTDFVTKAKGAVEEGDIVMASYYAQIEPYFIIYRYEEGQWVRKKRIGLLQTDENGYGLGAINYLMQSYGQDGFASRNSLQQIMWRLKDNIRTEANFKPIDWVVMTTKSNYYDTNYGDYKEEEHTFLSPCACFAFGNSVVVNFQTKDNYSAGTFINRQEFRNGTYSVEDYIKYGDRYGNFNSFKLVFGSKYAKAGAFDTLADSYTNSKKLFKFDAEDVNESRVLLDYRDNAFQLVKDSRQQISYTGQLHFVSEIPEVTFGTAFAEAMPFVGNTRAEAGTVKFVGFYTKPNKFLAGKATDYEQITTDVKYNYFTKSITLTFDNDSEGDFIGVGLIDNNENIMLYFDKEVKAGDSEVLYLEFRHDI